MEARRVIAMTAVNQTTKKIKNAIHELASQVYVLATGLQNAAPTGSAGKSVQYLLETAAQLELAAEQIEALMADLPPSEK